jgi:ATP-dependent DNA helicase RecG
VIDFIAKADATFQLSQREKICLGLLAQTDGLKTQELVSKLELESVGDLQRWLARLVEVGLVKASGRTRAMKYFVAPEILRDLEFPTSTTLTRIEPHRLKALVLEDIERFPRSAIGDIHRRVGNEIPKSHVKRAIDSLVRKGRVRAAGEKRWRRYTAAS